MRKIRFVALLLALALLFAACYDANGRVTKALPLTAGTNDLTKDSAQIKLFLLDSKLAPLCDAKLVIKE